MYRVKRVEHRQLTVVTKPFIADATMLPTSAEALTRN
jgi:hypothetical protein